MSYMHNHIAALACGVRVVVAKVLSVRLVALARKPHSMVVRVLTQRTWIDLIYVQTMCVRRMAASMSDTHMLLRCMSTHIASSVYVHSHCKLPVSAHRLLVNCMRMPVALRADPFYRRSFGLVLAMSLPKWTHTLCPLKAMLY